MFRKTYSDGDDNTAKNMISFSALDKKVNKANS